MRLFEELVPALGGSQSHGGKGRNNQRGGQDGIGTKQSAPRDHPHGDSDGGFGANTCTSDVADGKGFGFHGG